MSTSRFKSNLREIEGVTRAAELADGLLLIDGSVTTLLVYGSPGQRKQSTDEWLEILQDEFAGADCLIISVEGILLLFESTQDSFDIAYLPDYVGDSGLEGLRTVVDELTQGTLRRKSLLTEQLSTSGFEDVMALFEQVLEANLTTYHTPQSVARIAANWVTAGDRTSVADPTCGSGELLTAAIEATSEPSYALGIEHNSVACAITETRIQEYSLPNWEVRCADFFSIFNEIASDPQPSLNQYTNTYDRDSTLPKAGFDCVVAHPPKGRPSGDKSQQTTAERAHRRLEHKFVSAACQLLNERGRGCFIIPSHSIRNLREQVLPEGVILKKLVKLPETAFPIVGAEPVLACVERTSNVSELGLLNISSFEKIDNICGAVHESTVAERLDHVDAVEVQSDLSSTTVQTLLNAPSAAHFFTGDLPTLEDVTEVMGRGMITGHNAGFYFNEEQRANSNIEDRFFTPIIRSAPDEGPFTDENITHYLFDLREFVADNNLDPEDIGGVVDTLQSVDSEAANHVADEIAPAVQEHVSLNGVLPRSISLINPDIITDVTTSSVTWHQVEVDSEDVLYDARVVGICCRETPTADTVFTLLNTPLYQQVNKAQFPSFDADYVKVRMDILRDLPMFSQHLSEESLQRLRTLAPYESRESRETARTIILEATDAAYRGAISKAYDAVSPLSTIAGYESQIDQLETALSETTEERERQQYLINQEMLARLEETFRSAELFTSRKQLIAELLTVYSEGRYWSFIGGTAAQFEGMLQDYVESTGGRVDDRETEDGNTRLEYQYRGGDWKPLRLKILLDDFFSGNLLDVMQDVRKQRNKIAHGRLLDEPENNADIILLSLFVFTYALLNEYNRYLGAEDATV